MDIEWTIGRIIAACGGRKAVADALDLTESAVLKMERNGIKDTHWATLFRLADNSFGPSDVFAANETARGVPVDDSATNDWVAA